MKKIILITVIILFSALSTNASAQTRGKTTFFGKDGGQVVITDEERIAESAAGQLAATKTISAKLDQTNKKIDELIKVLTQQNKEDRNTTIKLLQQFTKILSEQNQLLRDLVARK